MKKGLIVLSVDRDDYKVHRIKIENWIVDIQATINVIVLVATTMSKCF